MKSLLRLLSSRPAKWLAFAVYTGLVFSAAWLMGVYYQSGRDNRWENWSEIGHNLSWVTEGLNTYYKQSCGKIMVKSGAKYRRSDYDEYLKSCHYPDHLSEIANDAGHIQFMVNPYSADFKLTGPQVVPWGTDAPGAFSYWVSKDRSRFCVLVYGEKDYPSKGLNGDSVGNPLPASYSPPGPPAGTEDVCPFYYLSDPTGHEGRQLIILRPGEPSK